MLSVKQLLAHTKTHRGVIIDNSGKVSITIAGAKNGKDKNGYYRSISGAARSAGQGKRTKRWEIRLYWPKKTKYIPPEFRPKSNRKDPKTGEPISMYQGPEDPPPFTVDTKCWVSCSCEYFLYHCEVADFVEDASAIKYSNGNLPGHTNPAMVSHLCKHLVAALRKGALQKALA
jgi:hypothetical protein